MLGQLKSVILTEPINQSYALANIERNESYNTWSITTIWLVNCQQPCLLRHHACTHQVPGLNHTVCIYFSGCSKHEECQVNSMRLELTYHIETLLSLISSQKYGLTKMLLTIVTLQFLCVFIILLRFLYVGLAQILNPDRTYQLQLCFVQTLSIMKVTILGQLLLSGL